jgi:hypothetical protein
MTQGNQFIRWSANFITGVAIIDDQHKVIIKTLKDTSTKLNDRSPYRGLRADCASPAQLRRLPLWQRGS